MRLVHRKVITWLVYSVDCSMKNLFTMAFNLTILFPILFPKREKIVSWHRPLHSLVISKIYENILSGTSNNRYFGWRTRWWIRKRNKNVILIFYFQSCHCLSNLNKSIVAKQWWLFLIKAIRERFILFTKLLGWVIIFILYRLYLLLQAINIDLFRILKKAHAFSTTTKV